MTSDRAARRQDADVGESIRARVMHVLRTRGPSTQEEILDVFTEKGWDASPQGVRSRCVELARCGLAQDTGGLRADRKGRSNIIWAAR